MAVDADSADREIGGSSIAEPDKGAISLDDIEPADETTNRGMSSQQPEHDQSVGRASGLRLALAFGLVALMAVCGLAAWLGRRAYQSDRSKHQREVFLSVGRQGALNLTTIDYARVDADIQRVLDSSAGEFHADFERRSPAFTELVKQAQSKSEGTIIESGLESMTGDTAQVLVAVSVKTSNIGSADQQPRNWRMRIGVQKVGDGAKVSSVGFVP